MKYDLNINENTSELLPVDKRTPYLTALIQSLLSPLQYAHDAFFTTYYYGDLKERINYNGQKLSLEYALNKFFGTTFKTPATGEISDIYITTLDIIRSGFFVALTAPVSSFVGLSTSLDYIGETAVVSDGENMAINVPTGAATESAIRTFVNKYIPISITYKIIYY